jgi:hypothetical protein
MLNPVLFSIKRWILGLKANVEPIFETIAKVVFDEPNEKEMSDAILEHVRWCCPACHIEYKPIGVVIFEKHEDGNAIFEVLFICPGHCRLGSYIFLEKEL